MNKEGQKAVIQTDLLKKLSTKKYSDVSKGLLILVNSLSMQNALKK